MSERKGAAVPVLSGATEDSAFQGDSPWNPRGSGVREGAAPKSALERAGGTA